jgi:hypothetical protein
MCPYTLFICMYGTLDISFGGPLVVHRMLTSRERVCTKQASFASIIRSFNSHTADEDTMQ